jgi:iron complex outermembrane receptor protein
MVYLPTQINQLAGRNPLLFWTNKIILELHSIGIFKQNIRCTFTWIKAVANFGYDELIGRSFGNTDADYLNGLLGLGIITPMKIQVQEIILMDLYLNYNKKVESIDTQFEVTGVFLPRF